MCRVYSIFGRARVFVARINGSERVLRYERFKLFMQHLMLTTADTDSRSRAGAKPPKGTTTPDLFPCPIIPPSLSEQPQQPQQPPLKLPRFSHPIVKDPEADKLYYIQAIYNRLLTCLTGASQHRDSSSSTVDPLTSTRPLIPLSEPPAITQSSTVGGSGGGGDAGGAGVQTHNNTTKGGGKATAGAGGGKKYNQHHHHHAASSSSSSLSTGILIAEDNSRSNYGNADNNNDDDDRGQQPHAGGRRQRKKRKLRDAACRPSSRDETGDADSGY